MFSMIKVFVVLSLFSELEYTIGTDHETNVVGTVPSSMIVEKNEQSDLSSMDDSPGVKEMDVTETAVGSSASTGTPNSTIHQYSGQAHQHFRDGNYETAIHYYSQALEVDSKMAKYYRNRGLCHSKLDNWQSAVTDFDKAVIMEPFNVRGRFYLGNAFLMTGKYEGAVEQLEMALRYAEAEEAFEDEIQQISGVLAEAHQRIVMKSRKRRKQTAAYPQKNEFEKGCSRSRDKACFCL